MYRHDVSEVGIYWISVTNSPGSATGNEFLQWLKPLKIFSLGEIAHSWAFDNVSATQDIIRHPSPWHQWSLDPNVSFNFLQEVKEAQRGNH